MKQAVFAKISVSVYGWEHFEQHRAFLKMSICPSSEQNDKLPSLVPFQWRENGEVYSRVLFQWTKCEKAPRRMPF